MCLSGRPGSGRDQLPADQELLQKFATRAIVIDYQRRNSPEPTVHRGSGPLRIIDTKPGGKMECAAHSLPALYPDAASHEIDQLRGNRKTKTCSAIITGRRIVCLG